VNRLQYASEYQIFQKGVKPMWEDPHNVNGGKWVLRYRRPPFKDRRRDDNGIPADVRNSHKHTRMRFQAAYNWEVLVLSVIGGSFSEGLGLEHDEILGLVISVRREEDIISVWNKRGQDEEVREKIRGALVRVLCLDGDVTETDDSGVPHAVPEYKVHSQSIREGAAKQAIYEASREKQQRFGAVVPTVDGSAAMTTTAIIAPPSEPTVVL
jgi:translation initiation factor 4E